MRPQGAFARESFPYLSHRAAFHPTSMNIYRQVGARTEDPFACRARVWGYRRKTRNGRRPDSLDGFSRYPDLFRDERGAPFSYQVLLGMEVDAQPIDFSLEPGGETEGGCARPANQFRAVPTINGASFPAACQILVQTEGKFVAAKI